MNNAWVVAPRCTVARRRYCSVRDTVAHLWYCSALSIVARGGTVAAWEHYSTAAEL
jgi:hypothetical protein